MSTTQTDYIEDSDTPGASHDTPIHRATVLSMEIDELDAMLANIRTRRLMRVKQLNEIATLRTERTQIDLRTKFERVIARARVAVAKAEVAEQAAVDAINKCRAAALDLEP